MASSGAALQEDGDPGPVSRLRPTGTVMRMVVAVSAGVAWTSSLPPVGAWWAGPVSVGLLLWSVHGAGSRTRAAAGALCGLVVFATTLRWATLFTIPGFVLLTVSQTVFLALATFLVPARQLGWLALPAALTLTEWARSRWPFSGLPVSTLALGQADGPMRPLVAVGGPSLLTLVTALVGSLVATAVISRDGRRAALAGVAAMLVLLVSVSSSALGTVASGPPIEAAVVQGGGPRGLPAARGGTTGVLERHLTAAGALDDVDLALLPENVVDVDALVAEDPQVAAVSALAERVDGVVVAGVVVDATSADGDTEAGVRRFRNLAVAFEPDGSIGPSYDKVIRVPFGEFVPFRGIVGRFADLSLIPRDAIPGDGPGVLDTSVGRLGTLISFEGLHSSRARAAVEAGATVLLVPTNAASYVTDDIPGQQVAAARLRATETGRWLMLAGPTGPSGIVSPEGLVLRRSGLEEPYVTRATIVPRRGLTPYVAVGDAPVLGLALAGLGFAWRRSVRSLESDR